MSDEVISTLCTHFELADQELDRVIGDLHLEEIARKRCTYWKSLPSRLGLQDIVAKDVDKDFPMEFDKRREFFQQWKKIKGSEATYRCLVKALLTIDQRHDAEYVFKLLHQAVADSSEAPSGMVFNWILAWHSLIQWTFLIIEILNMLVCPSTIIIPLSIQMTCIQQGANHTLI